MCRIVSRSLYMGNTTEISGGVLDLSGWGMCCVCIVLEIGPYSSQDVKIMGSYHTCTRQSPARATVSSYDLFGKSWPCLNATVWTTRVLRQLISRLNM